MQTVSDYFGSLVFDDRVMRARLPAKVYTSLRKDDRRRGRSLDSQRGRCGGRVPCGTGRLRNGATHFTALVPAVDRHHRRKARQLYFPDGRRQRDYGVFRQGAHPGRTGRIELSRPAACAPRLRRAATRRGIPPLMRLSKTAFSAYPTAFCSYGGEALDKKTPLLRSMEAINTSGAARSEAVRQYRT